MTMEKHEGSWGIMGDHPVDHVASRMEGPGGIGLLTRDWVLIGASDSSL